MWMACEMPHNVRKQLNYMTRMGHLIHRDFLIDGGLWPDSVGVQGMQIGAENLSIKEAPLPTRKQPFRKDRRNREHTIYSGWTIATLGRCKRVIKLL